MKYTPIDQKSAHNQLQQHVSMTPFEQSPKGWKYLAVVTKESNKINLASDVNVDKKILT
jgi:hypothetical protein